MNVRAEEKAAKKDETRMSCSITADCAKNYMYCLLCSTYMCMYSLTCKYIKNLASTQLIEVAVMQTKHTVGGENIYTYNIAHVLF